MKYPCSYLIYSPAFDALPPRAKDPIYKRLWDVLSGEARGVAISVGAVDEPIAKPIVEILRDTKKDLPSYFQGAIK